MVVFCLPPVRCNLKLFCFLLRPDVRKGKLRRRRTNPYVRKSFPTRVGCCAWISLTPAPRFAGDNPKYQPRTHVFLSLSGVRPRSRLLWRRPGAVPATPIGLKRVTWRRLVSEIGRHSFWIALGELFKGWRRGGRGEMALALTSRSAIGFSARSRFL